nr:hypothetical protein [Tanacetum cinerariifolium]
MHNDIMAAGSRERPLMVALVGDEPGQPRRVREETYANTTPENRKLIYVEVKAIHMILNGIGGEIYSTVYACSTAREIWLVIERSQQGESINKQDVKTNCFGNLQHQNEVNEIRAEKIARTANPLALVAATQDYQDTYSLDTYYQAPKPQKTHAPSSIQTPSTKSHATTKNKGKEIVKQVTPPSESATEEDMHKQKRVKDYAYHKEKIMLCKQEEKGVPLSAKQGDWLDDTDEEPDEQELEAHYMYMERIQEVLTADFEPTYDVEPLENV